MNSNVFNQIDLKYLNIWNELLSLLRNDSLIVSHFEEKFKEKLKSEVNKSIEEKGNDGGITIITLMAEVYATYLLKEHLKLAIKDFDKKSPNRISEGKDCDIVTTINNIDVYFEVKTRNAQDKQTPPECLISDLEKINDPEYWLYVSQMKDKNYKCKSNKDNKIEEKHRKNIEKIKKALKYKHTLKKDSQSKTIVLDDFEILLLDKSQLSDPPKGHGLNPDDDPRILRCWFHSMIKEAEEKGADYLMCGKIPLWVDPFKSNIDCLDSLIEELFVGLRGIGNHYESSDPILGDKLQGIIVFKRQQEQPVFRIIYNIRKNTVRVRLE